MKDKCLLMYEIKIQAWLNFNLLRLQTIANIVTIHQISAKVMFQGISGIICYFFCLFFENVLWKYCYEEIIPPIWHKSATSKHKSAGGRLWRAIIMTDDIITFCKKSILPK